MRAVIGTWTGEETARLRSALRLSMRAFAEHLGVATRTVAKWEAKGGHIQPLPGMQAMLDTALNLASDDVRERFAMALGATKPSMDGRDGRDGGEVGDEVGGDDWAGDDDLGGDRDDGRGAGDDGGGEFAARLAWAGAALDADLIALFEQQTQSYRLLDRRLGARQLIMQTEAHVRQMAKVLTYSLAGPHRSALAAALAEASALAGWQALDLGRLGRAWALHETARFAAAQSGDPAVIAHVCAQQAYVLLDLDRPDAAVDQIRHARQLAGTRIPTIVRAWLWAAEAEAIAGTGDELGARSAIDYAVHLVGAESGDDVPYLSLDHGHLTRWRGHCLARLGVSEAIEDLSLGLATLDPSFVRAAAGLHCDLAIVHATRREDDAARDHAQRAEGLAATTMSIRQQRRIGQLATVRVPRLGHGSDSRPVGPRSLRHET